MKCKPLSSTYIKTFNQCLQKYFFKYHTDKEPMMSGQARAFGTAVHEALEHMYGILNGTGRKPTESDYNSVMQKFMESGINNQLSDQELYAEGRTILKARLDSYDPSEKVIGLELRFGWPYHEPEIPVYTGGGTPLTGAIDKLVELDQDTLVVIDYKTSRTALTDKEAEVDEQLSLYDLAASILFPKYKNIIVVLDYLRLEPVITHRTPEQRAAFSEFCDEVYRQVELLQPEQVKPRLNEFCGWCDFRMYCTAYSKVLSDPDLLVKPLELYSPTEFVEEWSRFSNVRRAIEGYKRELDMHASNLLSRNEETEIVGDEVTLYKVQTSRVYYDTATVLKTVPKEDCAGLMSVNKTSLDKYLVDHPEYSEDIGSTAKISFASSFLKTKKSKKKK